MKNPQKVWRIIQTLMKDYRKGNLLALIDLSEATTFYIYRTDDNSVLARGLNGYDAAQNKAHQLRTQLGLKWDQVRFKSEKKPVDLKDELQKVILDIIALVYILIFEVNI